MASHIVTLEAAAAIIAAPATIARSVAHNYPQGPNPLMTLLSAEFVARLVQLKQAVKPISLVVVT
jgi:hypothetical protein